MDALEFFVILALVLFACWGFYIAGMRDGRRLYQIELRVSRNRGNDLNLVVFQEKE